MMCGLCANPESANNYGHGSGKSTSLAFHATESISHLRLCMYRAHPHGKKPKGVPLPFASQATGELEGGPEIPHGEVVRSLLVGHELTDAW